MYIFSIDDTLHKFVRLTIDNHWRFLLERIL